MLRYIYSTPKDQVNAEAVREILLQTDVDVNLIVNDNSAILVALNRYLPASIMQVLFEFKANGNMKTTEGRLIYELIFEQGVREGDMIKQGIMCFKRAYKDVILTKESADFIASKDFKHLIVVNTRSSVINIPII